MTVDEYRRALSALTPEQLHAFRERWGGDSATVEECVREFVYVSAADRPQWERTIVFHLSALGVSGLQTEDEKLLELARDSAVAAKASAAAADRSATAAETSARTSSYAVAAALLTVIAMLVLQRCG